MQFHQLKRRDFITLLGGATGIRRLAVLLNGEAKRLRSLEIDDEFVFGRLLDRQVTGFVTFEDTIDIASSLPEHVSLVRSIRNQSAVPRKKRKIVHCRQTVSIH